jgi:hypothetical protein
MQLDMLAPTVPTSSSPAIPVATPSPTVTASKAPTVLHYARKQMKVPMNNTFEL